MKENVFYRLLVASLSVVFFAFGVPKIIGNSSVSELIYAAYPFFNSTFIMLLGLIEVLLAILLLVKKTRTVAASLVLIHLMGTFFSFFLNVGYFLDSKTIFTLEGEFVFKNIVFVALALYIISVENSGRVTRFLYKSNDSKQN